MMMTVPCLFLNMSFSLIRWACDYSDDDDDDGNDDDDDDDDDNDDDDDDTL